jgi:phosphoserine phosphatase
MDSDQIRRALASWRDAPAKQSLIGFLCEVTHGPNALPAEERVAAFDNDGTLACEKPETMSAAFLRDRLAASGSKRPGSGREVRGHEVLRALGTLFAGVPTAEYEAYAREFLSRAVHPRFRRPYPALIYQPMLELVNLLHALRFSVFVCTDSSRDFMRVMTGPAYGLPRERVIGSEVQIESVDGRLIRTATPIPLDDGPGKTVHLWDRAGASPLLAAGNAAGDIALLTAARHAVVIHHDDSDREYAYDDPQILRAAGEYRWTVLSMRNDFTHLWPAHTAAPTARRPQPAE